MKVPFVDLYKQYLGLKSEIDTAIADVITNTSFIRGPYVDRFEKLWAEELGISHCISCANGTDAIYISMKALGIKPGDEVITTAHSWISTTETITQAGGKVVFCDTEIVTFNIDPALIESKITPKTVGIIPVHLYGQPCDMESIMAIAKKNGLWVIEDCAQAHLSKFKNQLVGTFGDMATFSFYPGKNLGAYGDAGGLVTNNSELADWAATYARHGGKGEHVMEGINSRMDGIQGAVLSVKLPHLSNWSDARRRIAKQYSQALAGIGDIVTPLTADEREHVFHLYVIRTDRRDELKQYLKDNEIPTVLNYPKALPFYPAYSYLNHTPEDFPVAYENQSRILSLPIFPEMEEGQVNYVTDTIKAFFS